jgi:hypothetical protein
MAPNHVLAEKPETNSQAPAAGPPPQVLEQAGLNVPAPSAGEQDAENVGNSSRPAGRRAAKVGKKAAGLRKMEASGEGTVDPARPATEAADAAAATDPAAKLAPEAGAPDKTLGTVGVLQDRLADSPPSAGATRRTAPRPGPRGVNENRPAGNEPRPAGEEDQTRLASEPRISMLTDADLPDKRARTPAQPGQPHHANEPAGVSLSDRVVARGESAGSTAPGSQASAESPRGDAAERVQFVQRVTRAFEAATDRGGTIRLRLHPPELGSLRLELTVRNGAMNARMETETETARNMLLDNLPALRERLAEHQIKVERFDVDWQAQAQGGLPQQAGDQSRWQAPAARWLPGPVASSPGEPAVETPAHPPTRPSAGTSFDVVI